MATLAFGGVIVLGSWAKYRQTDEESRHGRESHDPALALCIGPRINTISGI